MATRSLNKVLLIGNLTRDPELRYTPTGAAVCTIGLATNRTWTTETGEKKEEVEYHRLVSWNKLAELCSQLLSKGRKIYVEGRLQTRNWTGQDGHERQTTEIVMDDMIILDSRKDTDPNRVETHQAPPAPRPAAQPVATAPPAPTPPPVNEEVNVDDIPF
jgi:single-strand DNA-binding protein